MDPATISTAFASLKFAKDVFKDLISLKASKESETRISEALSKLGEAQDIIFNLREELYRQQDEIQTLKQSIETANNWNAQLEQYELVTTDGGAVVFKFKKAPEHYCCPACVNEKKLQILQDLRVMSGAFECPGCGKKIRINPAKSIGNVRRQISCGEYE